MRRLWMSVLYCKWLSGCSLWLVVVFNKVLVAGLRLVCEYCCWWCMLHGGCGSVSHGQCGWFTTRPQAGGAAAWPACGEGCPYTSCRSAARLPSRSAAMFRCMFSCLAGRQCALAYERSCVAVLRVSPRQHRHGALQQVVRGVATECGRRGTSVTHHGTSLFISDESPNGFCGCRNYCLTVYQ
jgi:hypothetical protein